MAKNAIDKNIFRVLVLSATQILWSSQIMAILGLFLLYFRLFTTVNSK